MTGVFMVNWMREVYVLLRTITEWSPVYADILASHVGEQHLSRSTGTVCSGHIHFILICYFKHLYCWHWLIIITLCVYVSPAGLCIGQRRFVYVLLTYIMSTKISLSLFSALLLEFNPLIMNDVYRRRPTATSWGNSHLEWVVGPP